MNNLQFMDEVEKSYQRSIKVLQEKEKEYAEESDRLIQFYRVANRRGCNPCEALISMAAKHYDSIELMAKNPTEFTIEEWNGKLTDLRNYTFLFDALLRDNMEIE